LDDEDKYITTKEYLKSEWNRPESVNMSDSRRFQHNYYQIAGNSAVSS